MSTLLAVAPQGEVYLPPWDLGAGSFTLIGDPPQWGDVNLDTTFSVQVGSSGFFPMPIAAFDAVPLIEAVNLEYGVTVRMSQVSEGNPQPWITWKLRGISDGAVLATGDAAIPPLTPSYQDIPLVSVLEDPVPRMAAGDLAVEVSHAAPFGSYAMANTARIFGVSLWITVGDEPPAPVLPRPCVLYPRADGAGVGIKRHWPRSRSSQSSGRGAGTFN